MSIGSDIDLDIELESNSFQDSTNHPNQNFSYYKHDQFSESSEQFKKPNFNQLLLPDQFLNQFSSNAHSNEDSNELIIQSPIIQQKLQEPEKPPFKLDLNFVYKDNLLPVSTDFQNSVSLQSSTPLSANSLDLNQFSQVSSLQQAQPQCEVPVICAFESYNQETQSKIQPVKIPLSQPNIKNAKARVQSINTSYKNPKFGKKRNSQDSISKPQIIRKQASNVEIVVKSWKYNIKHQKYYLGPFQDTEPTSTSQERVSKRPPILLKKSDLNSTLEQPIDVQNSKVTCINTKPPIQKVFQTIKNKHKQKETVKFIDLREQLLNQQIKQLDKKLLVASKSTQLAPCLKQDSSTKTYQSVAYAKNKRLNQGSTGRTKANFEISPPANSANNFLKPSHNQSRDEKATLMHQAQTTRGNSKCEPLQLKITLKAENLLSNPEIIISTNEISQIPHYESIDSDTSILNKNSPFKPAKNIEQPHNDMAGPNSVSEELKQKSMTIQKNYSSMEQTFKPNQQQFFQSNIFRKLIQRQQNSSTFETREQIAKRLQLQTNQAAHNISIVQRKPKQAISQLGRLETKIGMLDQKKLRSRNGKTVKNGGDQEITNFGLQSQESIRNVKTHRVQIVNPVKVQVTQYSDAGKIIRREINNKHESEIRENKSGIDFLQESREYNQIIESLRSMLVVPTSIKAGSDRRYSTLVGDSRSNNGSVFESGRSITSSHSARSEQRRKKMKFQLELKREMNEIKSQILQMKKFDTLIVKS